MRAEARGGLERFCSAGKGRGLRALRPFHVGDLLFSCPAYACVLTVGERGHHCECCFARYAAATVRDRAGGRDHAGPRVPRSVQPRPAPRPTRVCFDSGFLSGPGGPEMGGSPTHGE